ncbi:MAG: ammonia channel protein, partial [Nitrosomonadales bacterium]|nr:ammonia channel protein [Nitrosomonadales bacterium]
MTKLFSKFSLTGLMGLLMMGFSHIAMSEEMAAVVEEVATINSGDTAWMIM